MKHPPRRGLCLTELLLVVALAVLLLRLLLPVGRQLLRQAQLSALCWSLGSSLQTARAHSMAHGMPTLVTPLDQQDWHNGWRVYLDADHSGDFSPQQDRLLLNIAPPAATLHIHATGTAGSQRPYVLFDANGFPRTHAGGFAALSLTLASRDPTEAAQPRRILLSGTGRLRTCRPALDPACTPLVALGSR